MEYLGIQIQILLANWQQALTGGIIVSCSIIVLMGVLKMAWLGKIKNKLLRKVILSFVSVALVFPVTAWYFFIDNISFDHYWVGSALTALMTIFTYWLYENTGCRNLIEFIGTKTLGKWFTEIKVAYVDKKNTKALQNSLAMTTDELKEEIKKGIENQFKDDEALKGL